MKIRRALATAVAAAVTAPVMLLSVTPAFADTKPVAQTENKSSKPTIKELEAAAAEAQKAYDEAVLAKADALLVLKETLDALDTTHPWRSPPRRPSRPPRTPPPRRPPPTRP